jgi:1-acyl-sn-glycerol-3-phosphate acyltransferase
MAWRALIVAASALIAAAASLAALPVAAITLFRARRLYARMAGALARLLLHFWGVRLVIHGGWPAGGQTVYVSNHSSTLDLFVLVALDMPNARFFLSGFVQKFPPVLVFARLMGTFFTVPQSRPADRTRIFQRACRILRRTGESVYLSPEGGRVTGGTPGPFNRGAFHLAIALGAPVQPFVIFIPQETDPGRGYHIRPGVVHVHVMPRIDTRAWRVEDLDGIRTAVREQFVAWHHEIKETHRADAIVAEWVPDAPAVR